MRDIYTNFKLGSDITRVEDYIYDGRMTGETPFFNNEYLAYARRLQGHQLLFKEDNHLHLDKLALPLEEVLGVGTCGVVVRVGDLALKITVGGLGSDLDHSIGNGYLNECVGSTYASYLNVGPMVHAIGPIEFENEKTRSQFFGGLDPIWKSADIIEILNDSECLFGILMDYWECTLDLLFDQKLSFSENVRQLDFGIVKKLLLDIKTLNEAGVIHMDLFPKNILVRFKSDSENINFQNIEELCIGDFGLSNIPKEWLDFNTIARKEMVDYYMKGPLFHSGYFELQSILKTFYSNPITPPEWLEREVYNFDRAFPLRLLWAFTGTKIIDWEFRTEIIF